DRALQMVAEGADFIDIGGESTRPGAQPVSVDDEIARVVPVIEAIVRQTDVPVSIDTTKSKVADRALDAGAVIVNDISGMTWDEKMAEVVARHDASVVLMHIKGMPRTMQENPFYNDLIAEVYDFLFERKQAAMQAGIDAERIIIDPGIGFGKRLGDNFELIGRLAEFSTLGAVMLGPSRKSFIGKVLDLPVTERAIGTAAAVAISTYLGVDILRVHDVGEMKQAATIAWQCKVGSAAEIER
ncbi:MAG: dihydropteroate synthase, partial [bacterium]